MTHAEMHDLFAPGTEVEIVFTDLTIRGTIKGWRDGGVVLEQLADYVFVPLSAIIYISTKKETSHA